jgi:hypothetical protein
MKCHWILEEDVFDEGLDNLTAALEENENPYQFVKYYKVMEDLSYRYRDPFEFYPDEQPVVFYGSLNLAKFLQHKTEFVPGAICNLENFKYTVYAGHYADLLLNSDYVCLPLREAIRQQHLLFKIFSGEDYGCVFVRPDSGDKPFAGAIFDREHFNLDTFGYKFSFYDPDIPIIISSAKTIGREFRYFVSDKTILATSEYGRHHGRASLDLPLPYEFVRHVLNSLDWSPDKVYTMDIVETKHGWKITELNSFSCSGMYACDPKPIVEAISKLAEQEYEYNIGKA